MKKKVLFFIHDLGQGGAEKVLINLVNNLDRSVFDISVTVLFGGGVNEKYLKDDIHFRVIYPKEIPANSKWMKLFTPKQLHDKYIVGHYDIEVSYLEGPCARIISGCQDDKTKIVSWIHTRYTKEEEIYTSFRNRREAILCYNRFHYTAFVSKDVQASFCSFLGFQKTNGVIYNTIESDKIKKLSNEKLEMTFPNDQFKIIAVGSLKYVKRYDRLLNISKKLKEDGYKVHTYILGEGPLKGRFNSFISRNDLFDSITLLGYQKNPYKYLEKCDLFVCSSETEGFSTAATEALIVGIPVCTTKVSGMKELLGENCEYGVITENTQDALYMGIRCFLDNPKQLERYKEKAMKRGEMFSTKNTVDTVANMLLSL